MVRATRVCVTIDYGQQPAAGERAAAMALCHELKLQHRIIEANLSALGTGTMVGRAPSPEAAAPEFWPYRNQMLVTLAAMLLQPEGLSEILIGTVSTDLHADGRAPFRRALDRVMRLQEGGVRVSAPAQRMSTIRLLEITGFPQRLVGLTFSCHVHEYACGQCAGCLKHRDVVSRVYRKRRQRLSTLRSPKAMYRKGAT